MRPKFPGTLNLHEESEKRWPSTPRFQNSWCLKVMTLSKISLNVNWLKIKTLKLF